MEPAESSNRIRVGWLACIALSLLTALEVWISQTFTPSVVYLALTSIAKAALIVIYFMHVSQMWKDHD